MGWKSFSDSPWRRALGGARGRPFGLLLLAVVLALALAPETRPLRSLRYVWFDACQSLLPRARVSAPSVIVDVDEASLARYGQWPWPRTRLAQLIARVAEAQPAAIGVDMIMPEPDRLSPPRLAELVVGLEPEVAERLTRLGSSDAVLADTMRGLPVVLGIAGLDSADTRAGAPRHAPPVRLVGGDPQAFVRRFAAALSTVETIDAAALGHGLINADPQAGVVRRLPLVAAVGGRIVPSLGVEMLRVASGQPGYSVSTGPRGVEALAIGDLVIPTQSDGTVWMHYARHDPRRFVSAAQVLAGSVDPSRLARKLVLIGVTAFGLGDAHATPVGHRMAGVEIHAQLLEAIFEGSLLIRPRFMARAEAALIALGGLLLVATVPRLALRHSLAVLAGLLVGAATLALAAYGFLRYLFDAVLPMLSLAVVFTGMLGVTLAESRRQRRALRRQLEAEREAAARLSGELAAARRIQMGILPDPATAFPGETRFTLYAFLEPARMVGGDLYDFFALDEDRLFFLIGDVSGKGVPGSLFMAVCKSLYKSAVLRQARDVGGIMREANLEISRNNPESLFVAVFAGVLNTRTGELEYCNAGHDDPYLLGRHGRPPGRLQQGGGPPLCAMDHFPYTAASHRLQPGDVLCLVTDGVVEATNGAGELYRRSRLEALLAECPADGTPAEVGEAIRRDVSRFAAGAEPWDDMAILVLRWDGPDGTRGRAAA